MAEITNTDSSRKFPLPTVDPNRVPAWVKWTLLGLSVVLLVAVGFLFQVVRTAKNSYRKVSTKVSTKVAARREQKASAPAKDTFFTRLVAQLKGSWKQALMLAISAGVAYIVKQVSDAVKAQVSSLMKAKPGSTEIVTENNFSARLKAELKGSWKQAVLTAFLAGITYVGKQMFDSISEEITKPKTQAPQA